MGLSELFWGIYNKTTVIMAVHGAVFSACAVVKKVNKLKI